MSIHLAALYHFVFEFTVIHELGVLAANMYLNDISSAAYYFFLHLNYVIICAII